MKVPPGIVLFLGKKKAIRSEGSKKKMEKPYVKKTI
jgi:hypothetical protein